MLVSAIISRVRSIAGDVEAIQFSDATLYQWINDGMREAASDNNLLQITATIATIPGTVEYSLPTDILKLHSIQYDDTEVPLVTLDEAQNRGYINSDPGFPVAAWVWAGKIRLFPVPNTSKSLKVSYTRSPVEITVGTDTPELPLMYHMRLVDYCLAQVAQQDDDLNRYQLKMDEFRSGVHNLKDQPEWENDLYPMISVSEGDSYYYGEY